MSAALARIKSVSSSLTRDEREPKPGDKVKLNSGNTAKLVKRDDKNGQERWEVSNGGFWYRSDGGLIEDRARDQFPKRPGSKEKVDVEEDEKDKGTWLVVGQQSGHAYGSYSNRSEAQEKAKQINAEDRTPRGLDRIRATVGRVRDASYLWNVEFTFSGPPGSTTGTTAVRAASESEAKSRALIQQSFREGVRVTKVTRMQGTQLLDRARDESEKSWRSASGEHKENTFSDKDKADQYATKLRSEGWKDVKVWQSAGGWNVQATKDRAPRGLDRIRATVDRMARDHWTIAKRYSQGWQLLEGAGVDAGTWVAWGPGEAKRFNNRRDAEEHIEASLSANDKVWDSSTSYEKDLKDDEPRIVTGVKGMNSTRFSKRFPNAAAQERWLESDEVSGNVEVYEVKRP